MLTVFLLSVAFFYGCAECHYAKCCYDECHYAECRYAECRGAFCWLTVSGTRMSKLKEDEKVAVFLKNL